MDTFKTCGEFEISKLVANYKGLLLQKGLKDKQAVQRGKYYGPAVQIDKQEKHYIHNQKYSIWHMKYEAVSKSLPSQY